MITAATRAMNASGHTLSDLRTFAQAEPAEAQAYLQSVKQSLVAAGHTVPPVVEALLAGPADQLDTRIQAQLTELAPYFPEQPALWGQLQAQRAQTIGWTAGALPALHSATGKLDPNGTTLTLDSGATYTLAAASRSGGLPAGWLSGFRGDGDVPITVRGTVGADGKTFLVEDYAPGTSSEFTSGRVDASNPGVVQTSRGPVRIADPAFSAQLQKLPRLGVILPGAPVMENNELVYKGNPAKYYALGRFGQFPGAGTPQGAVVVAQQQVTALQATLTAYAQQVTALQAQLAALPFPATTPAETAALANLSAAEAASDAATAAQSAALQALTQAQTSGDATRIAGATQAYTASQAPVSAAAQALAAASTAASTANPAWYGSLAQRGSLRQQLSSYAQATATVQEQLTAAQAALATAQAAVVGTPAPDPNAVVTGATGDFAYSVFSGKPINIRGQKEAARANHNDRMWALGAFTFDAQGMPQSFEAEYLSLPLGGGSLPAAQVTEADDWLAALATTQAGVEARPPAQPGSDFDRHSP